MLKALLGGSYAWDTQGGLLLVGEYHFSGFGVSDIAELAAAPYLARLTRGDAQILGRHAGGRAAIAGDYQAPCRGRWAGFSRQEMAPEC